MCLVMEKNKENLELCVTVKGEAFTLNLRELATVLKVPKVGYAEYTKGTWPSSVAKSDVFEGLGMDPAAKGQREIYSMYVLPRILHRILVSNITLRKQKHNLVVFQDMLLVDQIMQKKPVSLPFQVMRHMDNNKDNPSNGLPYPQFVKEILKHWEIYNHTSEKVLSSAFGDEQIIKLGLEYSAGEGWIVPRSPTPSPTEEDIVEVTPVVVPVSEEDVLPTDSMGEIVTLLKELWSEVQGVRSELKEVRSELQDVKERLAALELAVEVDSGGVTAVLEELPSQIKCLATEIVEQLKVPSQNDV